jgi:hypothetical protein
MTSFRMTIVSFGGRGRGRSAESFRGAVCLLCERQHLSSQRLVNLCSSTHEEHAEFELVEEEPDLPEL